MIVELFWPKNLSQAAMNEHVHYHDAKAMSCFSTAPDDFFVFILANGA
jgi:hypothetical protein